MYQAKLYKLNQDDKTIKKEHQRVKTGQLSFRKIPKPIKQTNLNDNNFKEFSFDLFLEVFAPSGL